MHSRCQQSTDRHSPEEQSDFLVALEDEDASGRQTEVVLVAVLAHHDVHVDAVHLEPLCASQVVGFRLRRSLSSATQRLHAKL